MESQLFQFIQQHQLFSQNDRILLAVSGGVDSVVLTHLFAASQIKFGIAHCNFKLRGHASDEDENFVQRLAADLDVPFFHIDFDTTAKAKDIGVSIQMAARDLRYEWLEQIRSREGFQYIATAHHLNDSVETMLFNLTKGCGIKGLQGIPIKNGKVIRPILFAKKEEILNYARKKELDYREDASNSENKYARNKIRLEVIPWLTEINPEFVRTAAENQERFRQTFLLMRETTDRLAKLWVRRDDKKLLIERKPVMNHTARQTLLYEWLSPYGFNAQQIQQMLLVDRKSSGAIFFSPTHRLLIDRKYLVVEERLKEASTLQEYVVEQVPAQIMVK